MAKNKYIIQLNGEERVDLQQLIKTSILSDSNDIKDTVLDIKGLIEKHPKLALPVSVFVVLLSLATIIKTLVDGFYWAFSQGEIWEVTQSGWGGVVLVVNSSLVIIILVLFAIQRALKPKPIIEHFQTPYLSKNPILRWTYDEPKGKKVIYEVIVEQDGKQIKRYAAPQYMRHRVLEDVHGLLKVRVDAIVKDDAIVYAQEIRSSRYIDAEIYSNAIQRIKETRKLRVAVHEDPGEKIFCHYSDGKWKGFDIYFAKLIAKKLTAKFKLNPPIKPKYQFYTWPEVIGSPNEYKVDMAIASISVSDKRKKDYNIIFSEPYGESCLGIVAKETIFGNNTSDEIELNELKGKKVVVHNETTASLLVELIKEDPNYKDKIIFSVAYDNHELRELLMNDEVHMVIYGYQRAFTMLEEGILVKRLNHNLPIDPDRSGVVFSNISIRLRDMVNDIIKENKDDLDKNLMQRIKRQHEKVENDAAAGV